MIIRNTVRKRRRRTSRPTIELNTKDIAIKTRLAAFAAILLVLALVLTACTPVAPQQPTASPTTASAATTVPAAATVSSKKYVIASDATFPPMEIVDANKQIVGFDIDMMNAIAKTMGFQV